MPLGRCLPHKVHHYDFFLFGMLLGQISCKTKLEWHFINVQNLFKCCQVHTDEHACLCKCSQGQHFHLSNANNWRDFVGDFLPAKFAAKFLSKYVVWVYGEVCGEELAKFYVFFFSSLKNPPKFHNKLHHAPRPQTPKNPPGGKIFSTKYIQLNPSYKFQWELKILAKMQDDVCRLGIGGVILPFIGHLGFSRQGS